mgnify:CR=1 FL=1
MIVGASIGITGNDGAIIAVLLLLILFLENNERHKYPVDVLQCQVTDMTVHKFGREADVIRHHHAGSSLVFAECRGVRQLYLNAASSK